MKEVVEKRADEWTDKAESQRKKKKKKKNPIAGRKANEEMDRREKPREKLRFQGRR